MAVMKCPQCNEKVPRRAKFCLNCGFNVRRYLPIKQNDGLTQEERLANKVGKLFGVVIGVIIVIILLDTINICYEKRQNGRHPADSCHSSSLWLYPCSYELHVSQLDTLSAKKRGDSTYCET
jgi:hypothetical protein